MQNISDTRIELLHNWYTRIRIAQTGHYEDAHKLRRKNAAFGIPVVLFSAIVGTGVFASLSEQNPSFNLRIVLGIISILAAALASLQTFLNYSEQSAKHLKAATELSSLKKEIEEKLAILPAEAEGLNEFIKSVRSRWDAITNEAPLLADRTFNRNFKKFGGDKAFPSRENSQEQMERLT